MPKLVLLALADMAGTGSDQAWPSITYLEEKTGMGRNTVLRSLSVLAQMRLVEVEKRPNRTNIYRICKSHSGTTAVPERHHGSPTVAPPQSHSGTQTYKEPIKNLSGTYQEESKPKPKQKEEEPELPIAFRTDGFREAFEGWREMRKAIKKPLTPRAIKLVLNQMEPWGHDTAIDALNRSTMNNWQGVFDPREDKNVKSVAARPGQSESPKEMSTWELKQLIDATKEEARKIKLYHCTDEAHATIWDTPEDLAKHKELWCQVRKLEAQMREKAGDAAGARRKPQEAPGALVAELTQKLKSDG